MDFNLVDVSPLFPGWGRCWQGGSVDSAIDSLPGDVLIVCMDKGEFNEQWINHTSIDGVLAVWIDDAPSATLSDDALIRLYRSALAWLSNGGNLYIHCAAGISRASYFDIGLHMLALKIGFDEAFALVRKQRPVANPNPGFAAQLQRIAARLV